MSTPNRRPLYIRTGPAEPLTPVAGARLLAVERADPSALLATPEHTDLVPEPGHRRILTDR